MKSHISYPIPGGKGNIALEISTQIRAICASCESGFAVILEVSAQ